jgi:hypothetical protein
MEAMETGDYALNYITGIINGDYGWNFWPSGNVSFDFDGSTNYISFPDTFYSLFCGSSKVTFNFWCQYSALNDGSKEFLDLYLSATERHIRLYLFQKKFGMTVRSEPGETLSTFFGSQNIATDGKFHMYTFSINLITQTVKWYQDGIALNHSNTWNTANEFFCNSFYGAPLIGTDSALANKNNFSLAEFRFYLNELVLTEIQALYNEQRNFFVTT